LELLADVRNKHQGPQRNSVTQRVTDHRIEQGSKDGLIETRGPAQTEESQQLPVRRDNIFVSKGVQKLPFEFVRSHESTAVPPSGSVPAGPSGRWWTRLDTILADSQAFPISWPFRTCIELQSTSDLQHVRLVVQAVQGMHIIHPAEHV
jgi:hypothetical protein